MKTRRGSSLWGNGNANMVMQYQAGDLVKPTTGKGNDFLGVVKGIDSRLNKVWVSWAGGNVVQHDPDEIYLEPHQNEIVKSRMASRRGKLGAVTVSEGPFDGSRNADETTRKEWEQALRKDESDLAKLKDDLKTLQRGGTVENLSVEGAKQSIRGLEQAIQNKKKLLKSASQKSRRAMYWGAPDRVYRLTKMEQEKGCACCPKCKVDMITDKFTKSDKLYICPDCGFKVPTSKTVTTITVDNQSGEVDVDVSDIKTARRSK
jgi:hypothetical protein